ncbi:small G protein signaling modulator 3 isoform X1 [Sturnira hondurensis]|uniref:small G protein signaling modulator 3 isoform X1 n=1 Tax=Sturnira hondurensis TaxID=192404 RepID=UPI0018799533|nr:small G protein signaling modulator 3 isoform X1 [Sturnira hondurensis]XP_036924009.1 small G protein signaling modulator 3 isoform X1 [Sturnira hondurensis]XP_036924010.1 small G protein signaling modulator 3 isoform X1 [Sturnira hondurensis]XP_036924011.1 small G protein signaling modulator 3 isoform X1 [Sturnira hondurensis]XP_036924012.1 small G protein signaling modulator 3 isoform X1 [Sturnira hondurensis]XP_036924013.1 small G protein signaling modulator 3 isoform X1 [Sturnira hondur
MSGSHTPSASGPFSALTPSMWPQEILAKCMQKEESAEQPEFYYDEFGFRVDKEDGADPTSSRLRAVSLLEDPPQRLRWQAHLEFTHNHDVGDLTWDKIAVSLPRSEKLRSLVLAGIPHSMRPQLWMRLSGALQKKRNSELSYREMVRNSSNDETIAAKQIEKDLLRTMPSNACFANVSSIGVPRLRRVLRALAWLYPEIGYCQGTGMVAACLLLFLEEEDAFWMMCTIIEDLLPASYFSTTLLGVQTDQRVLRHLIVQYLPRLDRLLQEHDIELSLITLHWFLTAFASVVHIKLLLRLWDLFFYEGSLVLFQTTLGMLRLKEEELIQSENSASIFNTLSDIPSQIEDAELLLGEAMRLAGSLTDVAVETQRRKHMAYIIADQGQLLGTSTTTHLSQVVRRRTQRRKSGITSLLFGEDDLEALKAKNIKQTELLADLREAILRVARHFQCTDPKNCNVELTPDYSMESHQRDHENYVACLRSHRRRAKALLDFERHDDDELGFRKNDIITIISQKDEHCWVGELNGLRGWFPAKFVEVLDERSKEVSRAQGGAALGDTAPSTLEALCPPSQGLCPDQVLAYGCGCEDRERGWLVVCVWGLSDPVPDHQYSIAGDDTVTEGVTDLVRGTLCPALKALFEHGLKKPSLLGGACHPWLFIEEAAGREVERDFDSVYSRLVLCKTYRLDEDGKVLTPEELLYRAVQSVNVTHDAAHAQMDVKLRSLICVGLNEQVLHLWLEVLCSSLPTVEKWYQPWSFLRSPGWVQIKCELRVLCCFAFSLSQDWELPAKREEEKKPLKEGVQDMLVKHHLFSWDIDG